MSNIYKEIYNDLTENPIHWSVKFGNKVRVGHFVIIDENCKIGNNVMIGHGTVIRSNVSIGNNTVIGHNVVIEADTVIKNHVTIQSQCHITKNATIMNRCFFGPKAMCINTYHISHGRDFKPELQGPYFEFGCRIGAGAKIMPGIRLGRECEIGVGAVVTKDCQAFRTYLGVPAKLKRIVKKDERLKISTGIKQKPASFYNINYRKPKAVKEYTQPYQHSVYYPLWKQLILHIDQNDTILDIGCGPAQLSKMLFDHGVKKYTGVDISSQAIEMARKMSPQFKFIEANIINTEIIEALEFDTLLATEFFEHITKDLSIFKRLNKLNRKIKIIFSVPDFLSKSHVRYFKDQESVLKRYSEFMDQFYIETVNFKKTNIYLITGFIS